MIDGYRSDPIDPEDLKSFAESLTPGARVFLEFDVDRGFYLSNSGDTTEMEINDTVGEEGWE